MRTRARSAALSAALLMALGPGSSAHAEDDHPDGDDATMDDPVMDNDAHDSNRDTQGSQTGASSSPASLNVRDRFACTVPDVQVEKTDGCAQGEAYPDCKWRMPDPEAANNTYGIWRNTWTGHRWGRPALVKLLLATAEEYSERYPGEKLVVGDLDAPGPRHKTHRKGVDVDLYLPEVMETENLGRRNYRRNYEGLSDLQMRMLRARVEALARILAECTQGNLRIYYNDEPVVKRFNQWHRDMGMRSRFGRPMQEHNDLHRFHFHVTIDKNLAL